MASARDEQPLGGGNVNGCVVRVGGLDEQERSRLADLLHRRIMSMYELLRDGDRLGVQPWSQLWAEGHGDSWLANAAYVRQNIEVLRTALANNSWEPGQAGA